MSLFPGNVFAVIIKRETRLHGDVKAVTFSKSIWTPGQREELMTKNLLGRGMGSEFTKTKEGSKAREKCCVGGVEFVNDLSGGGVIPTRSDTFTPLVCRTTRTQIYWTGIGLAPFVSW